MRVLVSRNVLTHPEATSVCSLLDVWWPLPLGRKVLSIQWPPVEVRSFHAGDWLHALVDMANEPPAKANQL
jgi:hypothetical protein